MYNIYITLLKLLIIWVTIELLTFNYSTTLNFDKNNYIKISYYHYTNILIYKKIYICIYIYIKNKLGV